MCSSVTENRKEWHWILSEIRDSSKDASVKESCLGSKEGSSVMAPRAREEDKKRMARARSQKEHQLGGK